MRARLRFIQSALRYFDVGENVGDGEISPAGSAMSRPRPGECSNVDQGGDAVVRFQPQ